ncbi:MAG: homogentisate 1,2-dioxygenase [Candidatus Kapabacteria bacterium]|jgi:homogentisate 1,2-dioxygenase|nr:homogentisate 1,2-dioxygenase [Candidatus Kapabacteria bacterium]
MSGDFLTSRVPYLHNKHCIVHTARPDKNPDYFYKNSFAHEFIFVHRGSGVILSDYGRLAFESGDQIIIPQGTIYQMHFDKFKDNKLLLVESDTAYEIPKHYKNEYGQLEEHAPYEERDFKVPEYMDAIDESGEFTLLIKAGNRMFEYIIPEHPFDVVGWDGYLYPFSFNIKDYNPKVGRIHLPPPVHLLYTTQHFVLCNFNPRPFDWHEEAIPAPYYHSNIDSAEMLYYVDGDFMSRKGVSSGSITLHPMGIPHGPQPGKTEASVGAKFTEEYAVMLDTFEPLNPTRNVLDANDENYYMSWMQ